MAGKVVVVTGAGGGQGEAEALALAREGAQVTAVDVLRGPGAALQHGMADLDVTYRILDVADAGAWRALAAELGTKHGRVDGLVNNAGITWRARLGELTARDLDRVLSVNLLGPLLGIQALSPLMTGGGSIVNIGSVAALTGHFPIAYTTSKWALRGLTHAAALELGSSAIRVNVIHPGYIETPMTASASPAFRAASIAETPLGRGGTVDEVAPLVVYLISDESRFVTGAEIAVDGGMTAHGGAKSLSDAVRDAHPPTPSTSPTRILEQE